MAVSPGVHFSQITTRASNGMLRGSSADEHKDSVWLPIAACFVLVGIWFAMSRVLCHAKRTKKTQPTAGTTTGQQETSK